MEKYVGIGDTSCCVGPPAVDNKGSLTISPGTGSDAIDPSVLNQGAVIVDSGTLDIGSGTFTQRGSGSLVSVFTKFKSAIESGRLSVTGAATLSGTLRLELARGLNPPKGQAYPVVLYGSRSGKFSSATGASVQVTYPKHQVDVTFR